MPTGPKGEKRPGDVIGNAVHVMRVLTGEIEDTNAGVNTFREGRLDDLELHPTVKQ